MMGDGPLAQYRAHQYLGQKYPWEAKYNNSKMFCHIYKDKRQTVVDPDEAAQYKQSHIKKK